MKKIIICDNGRLKEAAALCKKYAVGVNADSFSDPEYLAAHPGAVEAHLENYAGIEICAMHGPYRDLCLGSRDRLIKAATMSRFEFAYEISKKLCCENIILHHGYIPATSYPPSWVKRAKAFFDEFLQDKNFETRLYIENQLEHTPDLISEVISAVDDSRLRICLDVGHANCNSKTPVTEWIKQLNGQIGFVHLHSNNGCEDQHLGFSKGNMNMLEICGALEKYAPNAIWGLEANTMDDVEESLGWLITNNFFAC